jgi:hypothetical protein
LNISSLNDLTNLSFNGETMKRLHSFLGDSKYEILRKSLFEAKGILRSDLDQWMKDKKYNQYIFVEILS